MFSAIYNIVLCRYYHATWLTRRYIHFGPHVGLHCCVVCNSVVRPALHPPTKCAIQSRDRTPWSRHAATKTGMFPSPRCRAPFAGIARFYAVVLELLYSPSPPVLPRIMCNVPSLFRSRHKP